MFQPVKAAFGHYLGKFYEAIVPTTQDIPEYINRGLAKSIVYSPSWQFANPDAMLSAWMRNDTDQATTKPHKLPVIFLCMSQEYIPSGRDFSRQISDSIPVIMPNDPKDRLFGLRTVVADIRTQLVFVASNQDTAWSLIAQFHNFMERSRDLENKYKIEALYSFAGITESFPVEFDSTDVIPSRHDPEAKNLVVLTLDFNLRATVPLYDAPKDGQPNDGQGVPGTDDPAGYPNIMEIDINNDRMVDEDGVHH